METILVTGHLGFIGSHLCRRLVSDPNNIVVGYDNVSYAANFKNIDDFKDKPNYYFVHNDVRDMRKLEAVFKHHRPQYVYHLAAESHVDNSIADPRPFIETNVIGTFNVLEVCKKYKVQKVLIMSTDEVYGPAKINGFPFTEDQAFAPSSVYSTSKASADLLAQSYRKTYNLPVIIARPTNNFGPNQHPEKLLPKIINNILGGRRVPIYGDGQQLRTWLYVEDCVLALTNIMDKGRQYIYNVGSRFLYPNIFIVNLVARLMGVEVDDIVEYVPDRLAHDYIYYVDYTKLSVDTNVLWQPHVVNGEYFVDAILKTINFYKGDPLYVQSYGKIC